MTDPVPQRIGDAERDRAAEFLREHLAQGRLSQEEFDERVGAALTARTDADILPLFADLPGPRPDGTRPTPPAVATTPTAWPAYAPAGNTPVAATSPTQGHQLEVPESGPQRALTIVSAIAWPAWIMLMFLTHWQYVWLVFIPIMISSIAGKMHNDRSRQRDRHRRDRELGR